jgi:hypothetical protein
MYDENKRLLLGSDHFIRCDARMAVDTIQELITNKAISQMKAYNKEPKKYVSNKWYYMQLFKGESPGTCKELTNIIYLF